MSQQPRTGKNIQLFAWRPRRRSEDETTTGRSLFLSSSSTVEQPPLSDLSVLQCTTWAADGGSGQGTCLFCVCEISGRKLQSWSRCQLNKRLIRSELKVPSPIQSTTDMTVRFQWHLQSKMWSHNNVQHHSNESLPGSSTSNASASESSATDRAQCGFHLHSGFIRRG